MPTPEKKRPNIFRRFFSSLGPGVITGAADDDPAGIATYSIAGAQHGLSLAWTAFLTWPLMCAVQMMCARIGMVTGRGLTAVLKKKFPKPVILVAAFGLFAANSINVGADLQGMAEAAEMLTGINAHFLVPFFAIVIAVLTVKMPYPQIARVLKWLTLALFTYVVVAFRVVDDWPKVMRHTFIPSLPKGEEWGTLVAILGTTISPYLFFWQASQEVEEEKTKGRKNVQQRKGATISEVQTRKLDVATGTFFSNLVMFFIIIATALTLHTEGVHKLETAKQAAEALRPVAGSFSALLYTLGILGVGFLAIPTLSGSAAYALSEVFAWKQGLDEKFNRATKFYAVVIVSTLLGAALSFLKVTPMKMLYWSAIINGVLAPFLLLGIVLVASDRRLMENQPSSRLSRICVVITILFMAGSAFVMFFF